MSKTFTGILLGLALCSWFAGSPSLVSPRRAQFPEPTAIPDSPPGQRLKQFLKAMNSKQDEDLRAFIAGSFAQKPNVPITPEERLNRLKGLRDDKAPFTLEAILDEHPDSITARLSDRDGEKVGLRLDIEPKEPHGILGIRLGPPEAIRERPPVREVTNWKTLSDLVTQIRADNGFPAMAVALVRDGKVVEDAAVGLREQGKPDKVQRNDLWHIGSVTKPMTSTLIARLIDQGLLRWDSALGELLPRIKMRSEYRAVTIEQILQHRGGIPRDMNYTAAYIQRVTRNAETPTAIREAYISDVLQREPVGKPGERMAYSNAGYTLAGYIAEAVTGKPYEQLMHEQVFMPMGMKTAVVGGSYRGQPQGHLPSEKGLRVFNFEGKLPILTAPAGSIRCSIGDLARFAAFHLDGLRGKARVLKPETYRRLHTPPAVPNGEEKYACGWGIVAEMTPEPFHGHNGSNGTFRAEMAVFPKRGLAVVAVMNAGGEADPSPPLQAVLAVEKRTRK